MFPKVSQFVARIVRDHEIVIKKIKIETKIDLVESTGNSLTSLNLVVGNK